MTPQIGIHEKYQQKVSEILNILLADQQVLALKTQNFHWNVKGIHFQQLHELFGAQYQALILQIDELAERIRLLGHYANASFSEYLRDTRLQESKQQQRSAKEMLSVLLTDYETVIRAVRQDLKQVQETGDEGTTDFLIGLIQEHEKTAWFLRSHLEE